MRTLALETSTPRGSLALWEDDVLVETRTFRALRGHNSKIFAPLEELLGSGLGRRSLQRLVVGTGPGSYTGVRVAIAIADALALSQAAELIGCCSLLAGEAAGKIPRYWMVGDARRETFYRVEIMAGGLQGPIITEPRVPWEAAVKAAMEEDIPVFTFDPKSPMDGVIVDFPTAEHLQPLALSGEEGGPVEPIYLAAPFITQPKNTASSPR